MSMSLSIEDFYALLTSNEDGSPLLAALRRLTAIERVEEIVAALSDAAQWGPE
jgi:hypothetical protein